MSIRRLPFPQQTICQLAFATQGSSCKAFGHDEPLKRKMMTPVRSPMISEHYMKYTAQIIVD